MKYCCSHLLVPSLLRSLLQRFCICRCACSCIHSLRNVQENLNSRGSIAGSAVLPSSSAGTTPPALRPAIEKSRVHGMAEHCRAVHWPLEQPSARLLSFDGSCLAGTGSDECSEAEPRARLAGTGFCSRTCTLGLHSVPACSGRPQRGQYLPSKQKNRALRNKIDHKI